MTALGPKNTLQGDDQAISPEAESSLPLRNEWLPIRLLVARREILISKADAAAIVATPPQAATAERKASGDLVERAAFHARNRVRNAKGPRERKVALAFEQFCKEAADTITSLRAQLAEWKQAAQVEAGLRREFHDKLATATKALEEISEGKGTFSTDRYQHVCNTINDMKELAREALRSLTDGAKP